MLIDSTSLPGGPIFWDGLNAFILLARNSTHPKYWVTLEKGIYVALKKIA
jgi:hypothetical protein